MRSETSTSGQKRRSVIEDVRRAQIIDSAIESFAELGYGGTSLARIAQRAGISKGVISYHFSGKEEMVEKLTEQIFEEMVAFVAPRVMAQTTVSDKLRVRIGSVAEYVLEHPAHLRALTEILNNSRDAEGRPIYDDAFNEPYYRSLEKEFRAGQLSGELREFDTRVMAVTVQAAIDGMVAYWGSYPEHDIAAHAEQLADLLIAAIRTDHSGEGRSA